MKIRLLCAVFVLCLTSSIYAEEVSSPSPSTDGLFIGIGPEAAAHTRKGAAIGGVFAGGFGFGSQFAAGLKTAYFNNLDTISAVEPLAFFRYYLPVLPGSFVQAEVGCVVYFENGENFPAFSGGLSAGWRFSFSNYYIEPTLRFGYPHMWGAGLMAGYKF